MDEQVDVLLPPLFTVSGEVKTREQANRDGNWIGTFNLWIVSKDPVPSIIYQQRSPEATWAPGLLDVSAGGHLEAGEKLTDGIREVDEELGKHYVPDALTYLGRKLYVGFNTNGTSMHNVIDVYIIQDDAPLDSYNLQEEEVYAICSCPVNELLRVHREKGYSFMAKGLTAQGGLLNVTVGKDSFPENYDNYHCKMAVLADQYFRGEKDLLY